MNFPYFEIGVLFPFLAPLAKDQGAIVMAGCPSSL